MSVLLIPKPELFSFTECLWFLDRSYDDCLHHITANSISKALSIAGEEIVVRLTENERHLIVEICKGVLSSNSEAKLIAYIVDWFDLERDLRLFYKSLEQHSALSYMAVAFKGLRLMNTSDMFEALCWSVIGQQINLTFAYKLKRALVEKYGTYIEVGDIKYHLFPKPGILADLTIQDLKQLQFSKQKAEYLINIAKHFRDGLISKSQLLRMPTVEKIQALTALKGVGTWTANYVVMKSLKDLNGLPHGDVGLLKALEDHHLITDRKNQIAIEQLFKTFPGWESYLVHYLWRSLAIPKSD